MFSLCLLQIYDLCLATIIEDNNNNKIIISTVGTYIPSSFR